MAKAMMKNYDPVYISDSSDQSDQENILESRNNISSTPKASRRGYCSTVVCKSFTEEYGATNTKLAKETRLLSKSLSSRSRLPPVSGGKKRPRTHFKPLELKVVRKPLNFLSHPSQIISSPSIAQCNSKFSFCDTISQKPSPKVTPRVYSPQNYDDSEIECCTDEEDLNATKILNHDMFKFECSADEIDCNSDESNNNDSLEVVSSQKKFKVQLEKSICDEIDNESDENDLNLSLVPSCAREKISDSNAELDEFLALIEIENRQLKNQDKAVTLFRQSTKTNRIRGKKNGYLEEFQKTLDSANTDCKFLLHDKNFNVHNGNIYSIVQIDRLFGVNLITFKSENRDSSSTNDSHFIRTVIRKSWLDDIQVGQLVEWRLDETITPYCLDTSLNTIDYNVYLQPNKIIFLK